MAMMMKKQIKRESVKRNAKKQTEERKEKQQQGFGRMYNEPKTISYLGEDKLNTDRFIVIPKNLFDHNLSKAALAVYPVFCARADYEKNKTFQISQKNTAFLTGINEKSIRKATKELEKANLLSVEKITVGNRHFYVYKIAFVRRQTLKKRMGNTICFYTCIIDNGIWAKLKPRTKALYLVLRITATQDLDAYSCTEMGEMGFNAPMEYGDYIRNRKWDICLLPLIELCHIAKIDRTNINIALTELEKYKLIERIGKWIKVYLKPRRFVK